MGQIECSNGPLHLYQRSCAGTGLRPVSGIGESAAVSTRGERAIGQRPSASVHFGNPRTVRRGARVGRGTKKAPPKRGSGTWYEGKPAPGNAADASFMTSTVTVVRSSQQMPRLGRALD